MTGIERLADSIKAELEQFLPRQRRTRRGKLSLLVATMLDARSANLMDLAAAPPSRGYPEILEYGGRWAIEPMFSDFKSRDFGVEDTHIHRPERLGRLLLIMALALHWAVSTGLWDARHHPTPSKKDLKHQPMRVARGKTSW